MVEAPAEELLGINSRAELAAAEAMLQERLRLAAMENGATLTDPASVFFCRRHQARPRRGDRPQRACSAPASRSATSVEIRAFCHIEGATHRDRRDRSGRSRGCGRGSIIGDGAHIGNFVELKSTELGAGAKANHLTYLGDATIGREGEHRRRHHHLQLRRLQQDTGPIIGAGAFIGSNTVLVAPVTVGDGAYRRRRQRDHPRRAGRCAGGRARAAGRQARLGGEVPRQAEAASKKD